MKLYSAYKVKIMDYRKVFADTARIYRHAVDYLIGVCLANWRKVSDIPFANGRMMYVESLIHRTAARPDVPYDFDEQFYKFPSYLRRAAISEAIGKVSSYKSNLANWEACSPAERGVAPSIPKAGIIYPAMYRDGCYVRIDDYTAKLKVYIRNTWDWITVRFRKSDADYIIKHCRSRKECVPTLRKRGKCWYLDFAFEEKVTLDQTEIRDQTILAVDLGLNSACTCSVMQSDGTILGRHFLSLAKEYDSLNRKLGRIRYAQSHGARRCSSLWKLADGINRDIAAKTAQFIADTAAMYNADTVVFEHLDIGGRKRGSKKQRLHHWRARHVQRIVADKVHRLGMRISCVNAWGTSRLAFDGTGRVRRGRESEKTNGNYSLCEFANGKLYNCDLNASYNIGARFFVREITKSLPVRARQRMEAKVPSCAKRSTCTLSTLISLNAELYATA